jgi:molecular chaperone GrpE
VSEQPGGEPLVAEAEPEPEEQRAEEHRPDLAAQLAESEDRFKRARADLDNYRKRSAREVERRVAESREAQLREWLESVDSVERALLMAQPESPLAVGLRAVLEQMEATLERQGVTRLGSAGERFDPERHEAVGVVAAQNVAPHTVVQVARSGYALGDRVLRPAQVIVSKESEG